MQSLMDQFPIGSLVRYRDTRIKGRVHEVREQAGLILIDWSNLASLETPADISLVAEEASTCKH